ncbi:uncharacterized protein SETTUDRAFT_168921 [Exserohilum turcica Et28A]|uniref:Uncharacterized protein n=1 Tax=Exserohilum turcicum (strain 28A) TaxID=671987 RepID=R0KID1_EXST2|nr:uncharacterized protein SETTUDRAFT_168921 [Exserohilum turcica Et28A]EOA87802.1 hypothetical protein SETTUDRAFT_168921 [Exserohilum turcica Et28A]
MQGGATTVPDAGLHSVSRHSVVLRVHDQTAHPPSFLGSPVERTAQRGHGQVDRSRVWQLCDGTQGR